MFALNLLRLVHYYCLLLLAFVGPFNKFYLISWTTRVTSCSAVEMLAQIVLTIIMIEDILKAIIILLQLRSAKGRANIITIQRYYTTLGLAEKDFIPRLCRVLGWFILKLLVKTPMDFSLFLYSQFWSGLILSTVREILYQHFTRRVLFRRAKRTNETLDSS